MRHPFAGILRLAADNLDLPISPDGIGSTSSRRTALKVMLAGVGTTLASGGMLATGATSAEEAAPGSGDGAASAYAAYLVVPQDFRTFRADRRQTLGVLGDYYRGAPESENLRGKSGFLAWLTADAATKVAAANDVADVLAIAADDKPGPGTRKIATKVLRLQVIPGGWKTRPEAGTFTPTAKLLEQWTKQFASPKDEKKSDGKKDEKLPKGVTFKAGEHDGIVTVEVGDGEPPKDLLARLKEHPQVVAIEWKYAATTEAVGEDGGATTLAIGEEGGVTTKALGEEGTTTRGLGEEGGTTTLRVGEEGGSTERLGEEGGVTTLRVGEEGATTMALGEEGGSTRALGEEGGGPKPKPESSVK